MSGLKLARIPRSTMGKFSTQFSELPEAMRDALSWRLGGMPLFSIEYSQESCKVFETGDFRIELPGQL